MSIRYCNQCFQYLTPGNIPPSHKSHAKDFNAVQTYCFTCRQNIVDGVCNVHHEQHLEREAEVRRQQAQKMRKVTNNNDVLDRGNFIPLFGSRLEPENIVKKIARDKIKS